MMRLDEIERLIAKDPSEWIPPRELKALVSAVRAAMAFRASRMHVRCDFECNALATWFEGAICYDDDHGHACDRHVSMLVHPREMGWARLVRSFDAALDAVGGEP